MRFRRKRFVKRGRRGGRRSFGRRKGRSFKRRSGTRPMRIGYRM